MSFIDENKQQTQKQKQTLNTLLQVAIQRYTHSTLTPSSYYIYKYAMLTCFNMSNKNVEFVCVNPLPIDVRYFCFHN